MRSPPPATRHKLDPKLLAEVPVKEVEPNTYVVDAASVMPAIENVGQVPADLQPMISPALSIQSGLSFNLTSSVVDGTLSRSGFTVTNSKLAQRFGIEVGDVISRVNGQAVSSPLDAWWRINNLSSETRSSPKCGWISSTRGSL